MLDNQLIALVISAIMAGKDIAGIPDIIVAQSFQPTQEGANSQPTAYLFKIGDNRFGYPSRKDVWDTENEIMVHTEIQQYKTTFQISALATQYPATPSAYTASDILNRIAYILQSSITVATFEAEGLGIERISNIRNPYFENDKGRNQASPSMDFVLTHKQIITSTTPILQTTEFNVIKV